MYRLKVIDFFSAAHQLKGYRGKCEELHGHNWKVEVEVTGDRLDGVGLLIDFGDLKRLMQEELKRFDHCFLNDLDAFKKSNPSSELLARLIYTELRTKLPPGVSLAAVTVWESEKACATYTE